MPRKAPPRRQAKKPPHSTRLSTAECLCLVCRQVGHLVQSCPYLQQEQRQATNSKLFGLSPPSSSKIPPSVEGSGETLCRRCRKLDVTLRKLSGAHPFVPDDKSESHAERAEKKMAHIPTLGRVKSLRLLATCPLCRFIFDITCLTDEDMQTIEHAIDDSTGHLALVSAWTIHRLERSLEWPEYQNGIGPYAKCIYTVVTSGTASKSTIMVDCALDAIGVVDVTESNEEGASALGVRKVDPETPNYDMIKDWLRRCDELHRSTCHTPASQDLLHIKLVDAETRKIVAYPHDGCDYIALSYVWGNVIQPAYKLGDILPPCLPATLEDALRVTRHLGKRYLWADSLCIEQGNNVEMTAQIPLMSAIYTGAYVTIVNLVGQSAESGLPRVGTLEGVVAQRCCKVGDKWLLSTMPTLSQQVSRSLWDTRAWTYQEGLLSPRCLFFTSHQVYFECNSLQCCESLDDSKSPFHLSSEEKRQKSTDPRSLDNLFGDELSYGPENILGSGVWRNPFRALTVSAQGEADVNDIFLAYQKLVYIYTSKKMTKDADSLNAFSAIIVRFVETLFPEGFLQGFPVAEIPRALLWTHAVRPRRRPEFPAWSWAGWEGIIRPTIVKGAEQFWDADMPPLRIWSVSDTGHMELVYNFNPTPSILEDVDGRAKRRDYDPESGFNHEGDGNGEHHSVDEESAKESGSPRIGGDFAKDDVGPRREDLEGMDWGDEERDYLLSRPHDQSTCEPSDRSGKHYIVLELILYHITYWFIQQNLYLCTRRIGRRIRFSC